MKAPLTALLILLTVFRLESSPLPPQDPSSSEVVRWLSQMGPRREGSEDEKLIFASLKKWFGEKTSLETSGFGAEVGEYSFSSRLWFRVSGRLPGELVVIAPTDGENHRGLSWAIAWADEALSRGTPVSITFLFTGAERAAGTAASLGSRAFLRDFYPSTAPAAVYLDTNSNLNQVRLTTESGSFPSPLWMVQGLTTALGGQGLDPRFTGSAPSLFRLDLPERRNALAPWFERSIPALLIASGPEGPAVPRALVAFAASLTKGVPADWDRHYLAFDLGSVQGFWGQQFYLGLLLSVSALLFFGYATLGRTRRGSLRILWSGIWQIPVLLSFGFLALFLATSLGAALQLARGEVEFWKHAPLVLGVFKGLVAIALYLAVFLPFRRSPLSRDPDFYGQAALVALAIMTLVAAAFELSFSFYFLWALVWAAVQVASPWRPLKLVALAVGPIWLFKAAYDILGPAPDLNLSKWALDSLISGNLVLAVLFLPFLLQVNSWHYSGRRHQDRNEGLRAGVQIFLWSAAALVMSLVVLRLDVSASSHPAPPVVSIGRSGQALPEGNGILETSLERSAFLDRTVWVIHFRGPWPAESLELELTSRRALIVYDSSFPLVLSPDGLKARLIVGHQPPLPLDLRITLGAETSAELNINAEILAERRVLVAGMVRLDP